MAVQLASHVPKMASDDGVIDAARKVLGKSLIEAVEHLPPARQSLTRPISSESRHA